MYTMCEPVLVEVKEVFGSPKTVELQKLWVTLCVRVIEPRPSVGEASALSYWAIFPAPVPAVLFANEEFFKQGDTGDSLETELIMYLLGLELTRSHLVTTDTSR